MSTYSYFEFEEMRTKTFFYHGLRPRNSNAVRLANPVKRLKGTGPVQKGQTEHFIAIGSNVQSRLGYYEIDIRAYSQFETK